MAATRSAKLNLKRQLFCAAAEWTAAAWDFIYPPSCAHCGREARGGRQVDGSFPALCSNCCALLAPPLPHTCERCGAAVGPYVDTSRGCIHCRRDRLAFDKALCLGTYGGPLRSACLQMKQPSGRLIAAAAARLLWQRHEESLRQASPELVLPIPAHWRTRIRRAHDASLTLAHVLADCLQVEFSAHILAKVRSTPAQSSLPPYKRRANLRGAFRVRDEAALSGRSVLLVDDILTTGTTASVASTALRKAGAKRVVVAVVARGVGQSSDA